MEKFGASHGTLKILKRGSAPLGGGEIFFTIPILQKSLTPPSEWMTPGPIKKIRGIASCTRVAPQIATRLGVAAKNPQNNLTRFIPDIFISTDFYKGEEAGLSPGYSMVLVAESTKGSLFAVEGSFANTGKEMVINSTPEDLASDLCKQMLSVICSHGTGVVDGPRQWLLLTLMALSPEDLVKIRLGKLLAPNS